ncbi:Crossover junction endonuclease MUS81 [Dissostichus eleginoides]|uniref:Crossover junction endonuclease MUS81 n=1 Tax=Dissostichus eleginoides TaxID=100907 RepID=A0AAD9F365_DISEL|nr:Crossover junction endonuclease MUS81 [Dissostichus eleginoides]
MDQRLSHLCPYQWGMTFLLVLWDRLHLYPLSHSDRSGFPKNGRRLPDNCMVDQAIWPFVWRCHPGRNLNSSMVRVKDLQQIATWIEESTLEQQMGPPLLQVPGRVGVRTQIYHHHGGPWALFSLVPDLCDNENIPVSRLFVQPIKTPAYERCAGEAEKEKLLSSVRYGKLKRNLGPTLSRTVYQLYCTQGALT